MGEPKILAVSPHYDDVVWSAGAHLASFDNVTVATVFAKPPPPGLLTSFDAQCGFTVDSNTAVATRRAENIRACTILAANDLDGPFGDSQYGEITTEEQIESWVDGLLRKGFDAVVSPVGLMHPDHRVTATAARQAARKRNKRIIVYEELPARVWDPVEAVRCIDEIRATWTVEPAQLNTPTDDHYHAKTAAAACYISQLDDPIRAVITAPERLWELT